MSAFDEEDTRTLKGLLKTRRKLEVELRYVKSHITKINKRRVAMIKREQLAANKRRK